VKKVEAKWSYLGWSWAKPPGAKSYAYKEQHGFTTLTRAQGFGLTPLLKLRGQRPAGTLVLQGGLGGLGNDRTGNTED